MMHLGLRVRQTRPTSWLVDHGASDGFYIGIVVDYDHDTVIIASEAPDDEGREVSIPRHMLDTRSEVEKFNDGFDAALLRRGGT